MIFRFAHISDLHLPPLPEPGLHQILNKRLLGFLSWHRKRKYCHRREVVAALEKDLSERRADHICITGDITNLGLAEEFRAADLWLEKLAKREAVSFVPGNHDAYVSSSVEAMRQHFERWLPQAYPSACQRDGVLFIGVSTAVATPPLLATGRLGQVQLTRLESILKEASDSGLFRVLLIHHPPAKGVVQRRKSLTDAAALQDLLRERSVDLVLHGHGHRPACTELESRSGPIPVFGAGSATLTHDDAERTGHYHEFELNESELRITHRRYRPDKERFVTTSEASIPRGVRRGSARSESG